MRVCGGSALVEAGFFRLVLVRCHRREVLHSSERANWMRSTARWTLRCRFERTKRREASFIRRAVRQDEMSSALGRVSRAQEGADRQMRLTGYGRRSRRTSAHPLTANPAVKGTTIQISPACIALAYASAIRPSSRRLKNTPPMHADANAAPMYNVATIAPAVIQACPSATFDSTIRCNKQAGLVIGFAATQPAKMTDAVKRLRRALHPE